jgi:hypothetical protein
MTTDRVGKLLEKVALFNGHDWHGTGPDGKEYFCERCKKLANLLRAGQAMRGRLDYGAALPKDIQAKEEWDAALATLEGRDARRTD